MANGLFFGEPRQIKVGPVIGGGRMAAGAACWACGAALFENARFCHACGSAAVEPAAHAEYKQVSVLFADVVHSMDIAGAVDAERLRYIMAELLDRCAKLVHRYGGTVDKFTGDGIMAVFGAPVAMEDHAFRACMTALDIQEEIKRLAVDIRQRDGVELELRVGLNSGQVIAGEIGSGRTRVHRGRRAGRDGATDGVRCTARRCDAQRIHRAAR